MNGLGTYHTSEETYRKHWATLTGRSERDIYIPKGLGGDEESDRNPGPTPPDVED